MSMSNPQPSPQLLRSPPRHLFEKDLSLFGDKDEICPHCAAPYIKPAVTNESVLFEAFWSEFDRSISLSCERDTGIKTSSELEKIGKIRDDEESIKDGLSEGAGKRQEMEERKKKMMRLKAKKKKKKKVDDGEGGGGGEGIAPPIS